MTSWDSNRLMTCPRSIHVGATSMLARQVLRNAKQSHATQNRMVRLRPGPRGDRHAAESAARSVPR